MSSIFGFFNLDGSVVDPTLLDRMVEAHAHWRPDERGQWSDGPLALGHCLLRNAPESKQEQQPMILGEPGCSSQVVVADVRLDNREELAELLRLDEQRLHTTSDAELVAHACRQWKKKTPQYLLGDFAFAAWDVERQELFCARDHVGIRPFYYHYSDRIFAFSSDIKALVDSGLTPTTLDRSAVALYANEGELKGTTSTFFNGVNKLAPASAMSVSTRGVKTDTYWNLSDAPHLRFDSVEDAAEALRGLLETAVRDRVRSEFTVCAHLSGGLDSSAICALAARELAQQDRCLQTFNWAPEPGEDDDPKHFEWADAAQLADDFAMDHRHVDLTPEDIHRDLSEVDIGFGHDLEFWYEKPIRRAVAEKGGRVILSGWGGDEGVSNYGDAVYGDLFWHGYILKALHGMYCHAKRTSSGVRGFLLLFLYDVCLPILPRVLRSRFQTSYLFTADYLKFAQVGFRKYAMAQRAPVYQPPMLSNRQRMLSIFHVGYIQSRVDSWAATAWRDRVEYRYPLLDKRILEFAVGLKPELYRQRGRSRYLFREACKGLLPDSVRLALKRQEPVRVAQVVALEREALAIIGSTDVQEDFWAITNEEYVNGAEIKTALRILGSCEPDRSIAQIVSNQVLLKSLRLLKIGTSV